MSEKRTVKIIHYRCPHDNKRPFTMVQGLPYGTPVEVNCIEEVISSEDLPDQSVIEFEHAGGKFHGLVCYSEPGDLIITDTEVDMIHAALGRDPALHLDGVVEMFGRTFDYHQWWDVACELNPQITREAFNEMWTEAAQIKDDMQRDAAGQPYSNQIN